MDYTVTKRRIVRLWNLLNEANPSVNSCKNNTMLRRVYVYLQHQTKPSVDYVHQQYEAKLSDK